MMPSPKATVSQSELTRYAKVLRAAGYVDWHIEVAKPDGSKVRIVTGKPSEAEAPTDGFDALIEKIK